MNRRQVTVGRGADERRAGAAAHEPDVGFAFEQLNDGAGVAHVGCEAQRRPAGVVVAPVRLGVALQQCCDGGSVAGD